MRTRRTRRLEIWELNERLGVKRAKACWDYLHIAAGVKMDSPPGIREYVPRESHIAHISVDLDADRRGIMNFFDEICRP